MFSAKHEFSDEWHRFLHPTAEAKDQRLRLEVSPERFPFRFRGREIKVTDVDVLFLVNDERTVPSSGPPKTYRQAYAEGTPLKVLVTPAGGDPNVDEGKEVDLPPDAALNDLAHGTKKYQREEDQSGEDLGSWVLRVREADIPTALRLPPNGSGNRHLNPDAIEDVLVLCRCSAK